MEEIQIEYQSAYGSLHEPKQVSFTPGEIISQIEWYVSQKGTLKGCDKWEAVCAMIHSMVENKVAAISRDNGRVRIAYWPVDQLDQPDAE